MRLAAGIAPVPVKLRAVNMSTDIKEILYLASLNR
jgi:hypothetical protein